MKINPFYEIIKDFRSNTYEIIGRSLNDLELDVRVCKMVDAGMQIQCETADAVKNTEMDIQNGYSGRFREEKGLYLRLQKEFYEITGNHLF